MLLSLGYLNTEKSLGWVEGLSSSRTTTEGEPSEGNTKEASMGKVGVG